jgi:hypothetical protein
MFEPVQNKIQEIIQRDFQVSEREDRQWSDREIKQIKMDRASILDLLDLVILSTTRGKGNFET